MYGCWLKGLNLEGVSRNSRTKRPNSVIPMIPRTIQRVGGMEVIPCRCLNSNMPRTVWRMGTSRMVLNSTLALLTILLRYLSMMLDGEEAEEDAEEETEA